MTEKDSWADSVVRELHARRASDLTKQQKLRDEQDLKVLRAPEMWAELRSELQRRVKELNVALLASGDLIRYEEPNGYILEVKAQNGPQGLHFRFYESALQLHISKVSSTCDFEIGKVNGRTQWVSKQEGTMSSEQIVKSMLQDLAQSL
jgi:hypothetical protein